MMKPEFTNDDINGAINLLHESDSSGFSKYCTSFIFGTENQEGINLILSYKDKDVATVASSGDQYLSAVYYDAKTIDLFDINRLTYFVTCLKIAAIKVLDYRDFVRFFFPRDSASRHNPYFWDARILRRLLPVMPSYVALFWDMISNEVQKTNDYGRFVSFKHPFYTVTNIVAGMPFYQSQEEYYKLQAKLRKRDFPNFIESDIMELKSTLSSSYDILYLSNILLGLCGDKLENLSDEDCFRYIRDCSDLSLSFKKGVDLPYIIDLIVHNGVEKDVSKSVLESALPHLKDDGIILLDYRPNCEKRVDWLFNNPYFDVSMVDCKCMPDSDEKKIYKDMVLTYKPKK